MLNDKRKYSRIEFQAILQYNALDNSSSKSQSFSRNISEGGACFIIDDEHKEGDMLDIELYAPLGPGSIFRKANIIWVMELMIAGKKSFIAGLSFLKPIA